MRIRKACIDGYGRFSQRTIDLVPGLQIVLGPNEQGKSTLRGFISEMLYGQKKSSVQRSYEESNELRCPWENPEQYGGRLMYQLDNGREIEVFRRFDRRTELVQVYDKTYARELTQEFEQLKNREPMFAYKHLGLTKEVFLNTATISHVTLDDLGDADAMAQIRERLLALADTGEEKSSADAALRWLEARIGTIGQPAARTRPLPAARTRLLELGRELAQANALRQELDTLEDRRREILERVAGLRAERVAIESDLDAHERLARAAHLREARLVAGRIDEATQRCFALRGARDFPLDLAPDVHRAVTEAATARLQLERTENERETLQEQIESERRLLAEQGGDYGDGISEDYDQQLADAATIVQRLRERLDPIDAAKSAAEGRKAAAEQELSALPDFGHYSDDPISWLNQMASTFLITMRTREEDVRAFEAVKVQRAKLEEAITEPRRIFESCEDFAEMAREYEVRHRMRGEMITQIQGNVDVLRASAREHGEGIPGFGWMAVMFGAFAVALTITGLVTGVNGLFLTAALCAIGAAYFAYSMVRAKAQTARALRQLDDSEKRSVELTNTEDPVCTKLDAMIVDAGCENLRELEAAHEQYRAASIELASVIEAYQLQERKAREADQAASKLYDQYRETFRNLGEEIKDPSMVDECAKSAIGRYHLYRDARRRISENREQARRQEGEAAKVREELAAALDAERDLALEVRKLLRERGYADEAKHDSAAIALRSYRIRAAQTREKHGRLDVLQEKLAALDDRIELERERVAGTADALAKLLAQGKVESVEEWHNRCDQAKEYLDVRQRLADLQEQLKAVLRGMDLNELHDTVEADGPEPPTPERTAEELERATDEIAEAIENLLKEEHAIHLSLTERAAGARSLSEIEEERALFEQRVRDLEFEVAAASHAMALIEEIARDRHARIAPRLAAMAGEFLGEMTNGAYSEILISRDLEISIRIPQTQRLNDVPQKVLSKGTVDQIYLALRLAMVQCLSENGETIPMLLDDPFANYDDARLESTLDLLARLGTRNQILLFTCREDVGKAAEAINAPILRL